MYTLKYCQLCLVVDVKTFAMNTAALEAYSKLLQLPVHNKTPYICYECLALLLKYQEFHSKCLRAHNVLTQFKMQSTKVITHEIFETQRKIYNLESKLSLSTVLHYTIKVPDHSDDKVNLLCNMNSIEYVGFNKINKLHEKVDIEPYVYVESSVAHTNSTEHSVIEETYDKKLIVTKAIQDTSITDLDDKSALLKINRKQLVNTATNKTKPLEPKIEIDAKEENNGFSDTSFSKFDVKPLSRHVNKKKRTKPSTRKLKALKSSYYIDTREETNAFSDTDISHIDEELLSGMRNSKELVDQATEIAKSILHDKYAFGKEENNITNRDLEDEIVQKIGNSEELLKKASKIVCKLRTKSKDIDLSFYDGFARVVKMTPEEARKEILLRKETSNYLESVYKCELCYRGFRLEITFDNHMKKHTEEYGSFQCEYCHLMCPNAKQMGRHINGAHKYKIFCSLCPDYVTSFLSQAKSHIRQHKGKTFSCDKCDAVYGRLNSLLGHKSKMHPREVVCALCGNTFGTQLGLTLHKKKQHRQALTSAQESALCGPRCDECAVQFATEAAYARHRALSHQQAASQDCEFCGETFSDEPTLRAHVVERHTQEQPRFSCAHCPSRFWNRTARKIHVGSEHPRVRAPRPREHSAYTRAEMDRRQKAKDKSREKAAQTYICEYCGKDVKILQKQCHTLIHTGERPYKCKLCGKGFTQPTALYLHRATHATTRQYQCDKCPKNYKLKSALERHIKTSHAGIRPHKCAICGKSFPFPCELRTHVKYVHEKTPWPTRVRKRKAEPSLQEEMEN